MEEKDGMGKEVEDMGREAEKKGGRALCGKGAVTSKGKNAGGKGSKGGGKGFGYQGTCFTCGKVGHKAAECGGIYEVHDGDDEDAGKDVG